MPIITEFTDESIETMQINLSGINAEIIQELFSIEDIFAVDLGDGQYKATINTLEIFGMENERGLEQFFKTLQFQRDTQDDVFTSPSSSSTPEAPLFFLSKPFYIAQAETTLQESGFEAEITAIGDTFIAKFQDQETLDSFIQAFGGEISDQGLCTLLSDESLIKLGISPHKPPVEEYEEVEWTPVPQPCSQIGSFLENLKESFGIESYKENTGINRDFVKLQFNSEEARGIFINSLEIENPIEINGRGLIFHVQNILKHIEPSTGYEMPMEPPLPFERPAAATAPTASREDDGVVEVWVGERNKTFRSALRTGKKEGKIQFYFNSRQSRDQFLADNFSIQRVSSILKDTKNSDKPTKEGKWYVSFKDDDKSKERSGSYAKAAKLLEENNYKLTEGKGIKR